MAIEFYKIRQRVMDLIYGDPLYGTATSGSADSVLDSGFALSAATVDSFDYAWVKIVSTTDGAAPQGEIRNMEEGGYVIATGEFNVDPNFSAAPEASDTYEIHPWLRPAVLDRVINQKLRNLHVPTVCPLSVALDADMEVASASTYYGSTNATVTKQAGGSWDGSQALKVAATSAGGYAKATIAVTEGDEFMVAVDAMSDSGDTGQLVVYDATNSANIDTSAQFLSATGWIEIVIQPFTVPDGCRSIEIRMTSVANTDVTRWDNLQIWRPGRYIYPAPAGVSRKEQIMDVVEDIRRGDVGPFGGDDYLLYATWTRPIAYDLEKNDHRSTINPWLNVETTGYRPYVVAKRPLSEVSADYTATTALTIPLSSDEGDALAWGAAAEALRIIARRLSGTERKEKIYEAAQLEEKWQNHLRILDGIGEEEHHIESRRTTAVMR